VSGNEYAHLGFLLHFTADTWLDKDDVRWLRYGCECLTIAEWEKNLSRIVARHINDKAGRAQYAKTLRALIALANTLPSRSQE
jgi:hypothetical protein